VFFFVSDPNCTMQIVTIARSLQVILLCFAGVSRAIFLCAFAAVFMLKSLDVFFSYSLVYNGCIRFILYSHGTVVFIRVPPYNVLSNYLFRKECWDTNTC